MNDSMTMFNALKILEDMRDTCARQSNCLGCPFCRFLPETARNRGFYSASKLCSLTQIFLQIPREIDVSRLSKLMEDGRK